MIYKPLRVNTETLNQLEELTTFKNCTAREVLQEAIQKYWLENFSAEKWVQPKADRQEFLEIVTGKPAPYLVQREFKSKKGLSDGVYAIAGTEVLMPASWFEGEVKQTPVINWSALLVLQLLIQGIFILCLTILLV